MDRVRTTGVAILVIGLLGYVAGVYTPYPGRAFSITAGMVGITVASIGGGGE